MSADNPRFERDSINYQALYQEATQGKVIATWDDALAAVNDLLLSYYGDGKHTMNVDAMSRLARKIIAQASEFRQPEGSDPDEFRHYRS